MKKKRNTQEQELHLLNRSNLVRITEETNGQTFFEIGNEITTDIAEAVAIMMRIPNIDQSIWKQELIINFETVEPKRALYWLTGGDSEWLPLHNYKISWSDCDLDFQEEFGIIVISILKKSKNLEDIKNGFIKYLDLPTLYDFALSRNFI